jgi:hypothetical protein
MQSAMFGSSMESHGSEALGREPQARRARQAPDPAHGPTHLSQNSPAMVSISSIPKKLNTLPLLAAFVASLSFATLAWHAAAGQNSRAGRVTRAIDSPRFEGDQYYVFGWACHDGNRASIDVHLYPPKDELR